MELQSMSSFQVKTNQEDLLHFHPSGLKRGFPSLTHMLQLPHSGLVSAGYQLGVDAGLTGDFDLTHIYVGKLLGQKESNNSLILRGLCLVFLFTAHFKNIVFPATNYWMSTTLLRQEQENEPSNTTQPSQSMSAPAHGNVQSKEKCRTLLFSFVKWSSVLSETKQLNTAWFVVYCLVSVCIGWQNESVVRILYSLRLTEVIFSQCSVRQSALGQIYVQ